MNSRNYFLKLLTEIVLPELYTHRNRDLTTHEDSKNEIPKTTRTRPNTQNHTKVTMESNLNR